MKNNKGFTLIEAVLAVAILGFVVLLFLAFFPQISLLNERTEEKLTGINLARAKLIEVQELMTMEEIKKWTLDPTNTYREHTFIENEQEILVRVKDEAKQSFVKEKKQDLKKYTAVHEVQIIVIDNYNNEVSELSGFKIKEIGK